VSERRKDVKFLIFGGAGVGERIVEPRFDDGVGWRAGAGAGPHALFPKPEVTQDAPDPFIFVYQGNRAHLA
jgi:hypothetical protein